MRRPLALTAAFLSVSLLLVGCSGDEESPAPTSAEVPASEEAMEASALDVRVGVVPPSVIVPTADFRKVRTMLP